MDIEDNRKFFFEEYMYLLLFFCSYKEKPLIFRGLKTV